MTMHAGNSTEVRTSVEVMVARPDVAAGHADARLRRALILPLRCQQSRLHKLGIGSGRCRRRQR
jgi:hypothetical protein